MMRRHSFLLVSLIAIFFISCGSFPPGELRGDFRAIVISDAHISNDRGKDARLQLFIEKINRGEFPGIKLLINTGDVVSSVYDRFNRDTSKGGVFRLKKAVAMFAHLKIPYYLVMGNHDYKIDSDRDSDTYFPKVEILQMEEIWKKQTGFAAYYSFDFKGWKFIFLNSMRGRYLHRFFDPEQMSWFASELKTEKPVVLFFHHPLKTDHFRLWCGWKDLISRDREPKFYGLLQKNRLRIKGIFVGHGHRWVSDQLFKTIPVYETNSFGDEENFPCLIVGIDSATQMISVRKMVNINKQKD